MREESANSDARVAEIAGRQHGVVTFRQLVGAGIDKSAIERRLRSGRLHRIHRGVYAVGHAGLSEEGRYMAAVLACGDRTVLSHGSAAALWGLLRPEDDEPVHVSLPSPNGRRRRRGIVIHRTSFERGDRTRRVEIPVTSPSRTILDLRRTHEPYLVRRAIRQARHAKYRLDPRLRADRTRSDLESDFLTFCRRRRIPLPEVNVPVRDLRSGRHLTVDFLWRSRRLVVETDSYKYHQGDISFEDDHERDLALRRRGLTVLRYTGRQLEREGISVAEEIRQYFRPR